MSVFVKTLLWFLGTAILTLLAVVFLAAITDDDEDQLRRPVVRTMLDAQIEDLRTAYAIGGRSALAARVGRLREITGYGVIVTDARGRDLLDGGDRSALIAQARQRRSRIAPFRPTRTFVARYHRGAGMWLFILLPGRPWFRWFFEPLHLLAVLALIAVLCYLFARYLTRPVQQLERTVERFGRGELSERAQLTRGDEFGRLARTFNQMADRIQTLLAAERRLLLDISHELRSPLARLGVAVELARSSENPEPHLDRIEREAERLNALLGELLQVTRAEGDPSRLHLQELSLADLVAEVVEDARLEAQARGCGIDLQVDSPAAVPADAELLRRAVENVVRNAIRYEPQGSGVEVKVRGATVTVRDHGPGVPEDSLERIFDPFYRVESDRNRSSGGSGLGLSIAKRAIALHKGTIAARNAEPGLEMTIELPSAVSAERPSPSPGPRAASR